MGNKVKIMSVRISEGKAVIAPDHLHQWAMLNNQVIAWFKDNPQIKVSHICEESGVNQGNLSVAIGKNQISEEILEKLVSVIEKYGFVKQEHIK